MRRSNRTYLTPLVATAVLLACSSEGSTGYPAGSDKTAVTAEGACEHEFRVRVERCRKDSIAPETMTSTRTRYVGDCVAALDLPGSTRTVAEVEACANAVEAEECGVIAPLLPACAQKAGTLTTGSACNVHAQCQSGYCELRAQGKGCGLCKDTPSEGEGCLTGNLRCAPGTFCTGERESTQTTCKRVRYVDANAECNGFDIQCRPGFVCASMEGAASVCIQGLAGTPCRVDSTCVKGTYCSEVTGTCTNLGNAGDACDGPRPCGEGLGCDRSTRTCATLTFAEPGESCGGSVACRQGVCGQGTGTPRCPEIVEDGKGCLEGALMTCRAPAACFGGACVMSTTATCQ
jgi:hypothetical protein